jgi:mono/diheme cytochrome c family protein
VPAITPGITAVAVAGVLAVAGVAAAAQVTAQRARGELLYATHCVACHTTQVHWRDRRLAKDFAGLVHQVRRWAGSAGLGWTDEEIGDVARYLNAAFYRFEAPALTERARPGPARAIERAG